MDYIRLREHVPQADCERFDTLWEQTGGNHSPLQVCLAGAFSTGKTTLLNTLLGRDLLPVAQEETTALPTFVEYAATQHYDLVSTNSVTPITPENLRAVITNPPQNGRLISIGLPLSWLQGLCIVDLPGSGSLEGRNHEYTREQIRQADAIIYLLAARGPSSEDITNLTLMHTRGKKVFIGVAHWDLVEEAVARGEKEPDLAAWAADIMYKTGLECSLCPISRTGLGQEQVITFLRQAAQDLSDLRMQRFVAEARPVLTGMIEQRQEAISMLAAETEEAQRQNHEVLMQQKRELLETRQRAESRKQEETQDILQSWDSGCEQLSIQLEEGLHSSAEKWTQKEGEEQFLERGETLLRGTLAQAAALGQSLSKRYGQMDIPEVELQRQHLHLAPPPPVAVADFLDVGRLEMLEKRMSALQEQLRLAEDRQQNHDVISKEIREAEQTVEALKKQRHEILSAPLPQIQVPNTSAGNGKALGRVVGEIADIALLFLLPQTAASKLGGLVGKAGKTLGMSAKTAKKVADVATATTGVKVGLDLNKAAQGEKVLQPPKGQFPTEILEKMGKLEMLTLGYWGERIGMALDGDPVTSTITDPEALKKQRDTLGEVDVALRERQLRLFDLEHELSDPHANIATIEAEMKTLQDEKEAIAAQAEQKKTKEETARQNEFQSMLAYEKKRCNKAWLYVFTQQCQSMRKLLQSMLRNWWEGYLPTLLNERESKVRELLEQLKELPAQRQQREEALQAEEESLRQALCALEQ